MSDAIMFNVYVSQKVVFNLQELNNYFTWY